jgi:hypothetical protein
VSVTITLVTSLPLAQEVPARMSASGGLNRSYTNAVARVYVFYIGSSPYMPNTNVRIVGFQFPYIELQRNFTDTDSSSMFSSLIAGPSVQIVWHGEGDYVPMMVVWFKNSSSITATYPYLSVHVDSADVARSERYNRVDQAVSIALVFFAFVEGYGILRDMDGQKTQANSSANEPTPTKAPPNNPKPTRMPAYSRKKRASVGPTRKRLIPQS